MSKDFIPAPASQPTPATTAESQPASGPTLNIDTAGAGLGTTQLVIAVAIVLALAAALYFVRGGVKSALVSSRATLDAANLAASAWYVFLLLLSGLVVFGLLGGLSWSSRPAADSWASDMRPSYLRVLRALPVTTPQAARPTTARPAVAAV